MNTHHVTDLNATLHMKLAARPYEIPFLINATRPFSCNHHNSHNNPLLIHKSRTTMSSKNSSTPSGSSSKGYSTTSSGTNSQVSITEISWLALFT